MVDFIWGRNLIFKRTLVIFNGNFSRKNYIVILKKIVYSFKKNYLKILEIKLHRVDHLLKCFKGLASYLTNQSFSAAKLDLYGIGYTMVTLPVILQLYSTGSFSSAVSQSSIRAKFFLLFFWKSIDQRSCEMFPL